MLVSPVKPLRSLVIFVMGFCLVLFCASSEILAQKIQQTQGAYTTKDAEWGEDMSEKLDKTIKVLEVVKEELKDVKVTDNGKVTGAPGEKDLKEDMSKKVSTAVRIWRKIRAALRKEGEEPSPEEETKWIKDINAKLDKTMETMQAVKEELEKIEEEQTKPTK